MSDSPNDERDPQQEDKPSEPMKQEKDSENRIMILDERDIPFKEERPPNLSPNYDVKVHRIGQKKTRTESEE